MTKRNTAHMIGHDSERVMLDLWGIPRLLAVIPCEGPQDLRMPSSLVAVPYAS